MINFFLVPMFMFIFLQNASAQQTVISGLKIEKKTRWSGNIIVEGDVIVTKQGHLIIEAGTNILFKPNMDKQHSGKDKTRSELIVFGVLIIKGQIDRKVTFSSASDEPRMGDWYGIRLLNPHKISVIENCVVEYAFNGISVKMSNPVIRNSQITLNYNAGILVEVKAKPKISKNIISENGYAGVITRLGAKPILSDNLIAANQIGIIAFSLSQPNLGDLSDPKKINQGRNNIFENSEYDVYNHTNLPLLAENNSWGDNKSRKDIALRIYDSADENKYGPVDFLPVFTRSNLDERLPISQVFPGPEVSDFTVLSNPINNTDSNQVNNLLFDSISTGQPIIPIPLYALDTIQQEQKKQAAQKEVVEEIKVENIKALARNDVKPFETEPKPPPLNLDKIFLEYFIDSKKGEIIKRHAPQITNPAFGHRAKGRIIVRAVVDKNGDVESAAVIKGLNPYYDKISGEAALKFKYKPGIIKGNRVSFYTNILFEF